MNDQRYNTFDHLAVKDTLQPNTNKRPGGEASQDEDARDRAELNDVGSSLFESAAGRQSSSLQRQLEREPGEAPGGSRDPARGD